MDEKGFTSCSKYHRERGYPTPSLCPNHQSSADTCQRTKQRMPAFWPSIKRFIKRFIRRRFASWALPSRFCEYIWEMESDYRSLDVSLYRSWTVFIKHPGKAILMLCPIVQCYASLLWTNDAPHCLLPISLANFSWVNPGFIPRLNAI